MNADLRWGRAWVYGDDINTDVLAPGAYLKGTVEEMAKHCLEAIEPSFVSEVRDGDVVVGLENFGIGSSREQAPLSLAMLGVQAVLAKSFARIFYRNAFNLGLLALVCADAGRIAKGDELRINAAAGTVENRTKDENYTCLPVPPHLMEIISDGGLMPHLKKKLGVRP
jgi:3-isopropylmalate/(R)-2-methylmalate dehydratase small subunit